MSRLIESRKRSERVAAAGHIFTGTKVIWEPSLLIPGHVHAAGEVYTLGIGEYRLEVSEAEVLHIMSQWCSEIARRRCAEEVKREGNQR